MSLKNKFFIFFLAVAGIPLSLAAIFTYQQSKKTVIHRVIANLESIANIQERRLNEVLDRHIDQVRLIALRTQMDLAAKKDESIDRLSRIIRDISKSHPGIIEISILNKNGVVIAATHPVEVGEDRRNTASFMMGKKETRLQTVFKDKENRILVQMVGPLLLQEKGMGVVEVVSRADYIIAITEDYGGLGTTGETTLSQKNRSGDALFITPLRFDTGAAMRRAIPEEDRQDSSVLALLGEEKTLIGKEVHDYRGKAVFAVTRFIDPLGWGLAVKIDQEEALAPISQLFYSFLVIFIVAVALVIGAAFWVARMITRPIVSLTIAAQRLQRGDFSVRATVESGDELGRLANSFNEMAVRLAESVKGLNSANKELEAFNAAAAHDLVAPLRNVAILVDFIREDYGKDLNSKGTQYLSRIRNSVAQMKSLIDDLLQLSKVGKVEIAYEPINISSLAEAIAGELTEKEPKRVVEWVISRERIVKADPGLIRILMINLLENAWKYTSHKENARIEFSAKGEDPTVFSIRDNGVGFDMKYKERLFLPFERLHAYSAFPGTGIGLATVARIIERHNGRIWAEGAKDQGACFFFTLEETAKARSVGS